MVRRAGNLNFNVVRLKGGGIKRLVDNFPQR